MILLSSRRLNKQYYTSDYLRPFLLSLCQQGSSTLPRNTQQNGIADIG